MPRRVPATSPAFRNNAMETSLVAPVTVFGDRHLLRLDGQVGDTKPLVLKRIRVDLQSERYRTGSDSPFSTSRSASQSPMPL